MKPITTLFVFLLAPLCLFAGEPQWKQFVQEETILIAHVDLTKIYIAQTIQNNKPIVDALLQVIPGEIKDERAIIAAGELGKTYLTQTLGIQEAYLVVGLHTNLNRVPVMPVLILPQTGKINAETLNAAISLAFPHDSIKAANSRNNQFVLVHPTTKDPDEWIDIVIPATPAERADFAEAFAAAGDAPIKIAAAMPGFVRKVVKDTAPTLPSPFEKVDIVTPLSGLRWKAVGIDPAKPSVHSTTAMTSELVALNTLQSLQETLTIFIKTAIEELEGLPDGVTLKSLLPTLKNRADWIHAMLLPQREGSNLGWHWEKPQFNEILERAMPAIEEAARVHANRMSLQPCVNKIIQLGLSFHNYADWKGNGQLPPPFTVDENNKPLHSWRVLVLPFLDQYELFRQIRLDEPWDSAHNKQFHDKMPDIFRCPASLGNPNRDTVYCMVVGKDSVGVPDGKGITLLQIADGTSNTIWLVERKTPVCWMEPVDVLQKHAYLGVNKHEFGIGSEHLGGAMVGLADGSLRFIKEGIPLDFLKTVLMKDSGMSIPYDNGEFFESVR